MLASLPCVPVFSWPTPNQKVYKETLSLFFFPLFLNLRFKLDIFIEKKKKKKKTGLPPPCAPPPPPQHAPSGAGGVGQVEDDGGVGGLVADGAGGGVDERRVAVGHDPVAWGLRGGLERRVGGGGSK